MSKPVILVTRPDRIIDMTRIFFRLLIWMAGARCIIVTPNHHEYDDYDGLILSGGADIEPMRYGEPLDDYVSYDIDRDNFEFQMMDNAFKKNKPIFGVCRGMQLINIYLGGSLFTDLKKIYDHLYLPQFFLSKAFYRKNIKAFGRSFLNETGDERVLRVNSIHHQSVKDIGRDLIVVARDEHDIVQAITHKNKVIYGVQWHPEYLIFRKKQRDIIFNFINQLT